ncbi:class II histone deacetylase [Halorubrum sp. JWXQ-INN 858]|uniref:class II histone deacetylase n=1 Tax=Halorubrum sp. JWXQ-INN 858 TaxID=2690782 RepID=UPI00135B1F4C|nr:class II histone deacetylase [Halorubrum sp. JWXQ-INN 858]MWV64853.1 class II histone deacetylase [Halorubrum sp. JWXQ-INN 858]
MREDHPLAVYWHPATLKHRPPDGAFKLPSCPFLATDEPHPDRPARVRNVKRVVEETFGSAVFTAADPAPRSALERVHDPDYVAWLREFAADGGGYVDGTTTAGNDATFEAARHAAGAAIAATDHALTDRPGAPYALARPSGHHAQSDRADGFCFLNNAAIAAGHALADGLDRVAIVDWDVHHGNGTQEVFEDRDDVLFVSVHNDHGAWDPTYHPQTGGLEEVGVDDGEGYTVNVPVPPGTGDRGYEAVFERLVEPIVTAYDPDLILYSAGQDPGPSDPLGRNVVTRDGFRTLGARARELAATTADGRYALLQEGGYQVSHLAFATLGVLEGATGRTFDLPEHGAGDPFAWLEEETGPLEDAVESACDHHGEFWPV